MAGRQENWLKTQELTMDMWVPQFISPLVDLTPVKDESGNYQPVSTQRDGSAVVAKAPAFTASTIVVNAQALESLELENRAKAKAEEEEQERLLVEKKKQEMVQTAAFQKIREVLVAARANRKIQEQAAIEAGAT